MWKNRKKNKGIYNDFTDLDKSLNINDNHNKEKNDALSDRFGFYIRDVNNNRQLIDEIGNEELNNEINKNKNNINNIPVAVENNTPALNNNQNQKIIHEKIMNLEYQMSILNENILVLNEKLEMIREKIIEKQVNNYENLVKSSEIIKQNQENITKNTGKLSWLENEQLVNENREINSILETNNTSEKYRNLNNLILSAKEKNNIVKDDNINYGNSIELSIKKRVELRNSSDDINHPYYKLRQKLLQQNNTKSLNQFLKNVSDQKKYWRN